MSIIEIKNLTKTYDKKTILNKVNYSIEEGKITAIIGSSGKGKSTLMNIMGLIEGFDSGDLTILGNKNVKPNSTKAAKIIRENICYLFQNFALVDNETVEQNLLLALKYVDMSKSQKESLINEKLKYVGLPGYKSRKIYTLSGGEQQRVAIARILVNPKRIILADEPTGSLDTENRDIIFNYLKNLNKNGSTLIIVTHDKTIASYCDTIIQI